MYLSIKIESLFISGANIMNMLIFKCWEFNNFFVQKFWIINTCYVFSYFFRIRNETSKSDENVAVLSQIQSGYQGNQSVGGRVKVQRSMSVPIGTTGVPLSPTADPADVALLMKLEEANRWEKCFVVLFKSVTASILYCTELKFHENL